MLQGLLGVLSHGILGGLLESYWVLLSVSVIWGTIDGLSDFILVLLVYYGDDIGVIHGV